MVQEKDEFVRKRVLYIGSAVPMETADGLEGVQKPLLERYPVDDDNNIEGILSFISILPSGITLQYVSDPSRILFFPITSLTLCAAVRCVTTTNTLTGDKAARFVSLSSPAAGGANSRRPAIFTMITRRTEGRKVLECHGFICASSKDALELVQFTSYADRLSKGKIGGGTLQPAGSTFHLDGGGPIATPRALDTTFRSTKAASVSGASHRGGPVDGEHPVRLVSGEGANHRVAPEFYEPVPQHGYFYKTRDSQIKTYTVERMVDGEAERLRAVSAQPAIHGPFLRGGPPASERRYLISPPPALNQTLPLPQKQYPPLHALPHPLTRTLIPMRSMPAPATVVRPRFFSPPPPLLRPRSMVMPQPHPIVSPRDPYVFLPPPPNFVDPPYVARRSRLARRSQSDSSSRSSSGSSSPGTVREMNGRGRRGAANGDGADGGSSDLSSRPRTPPTDYEQRGPRVSRKEQFDRSRYPRELNGGAVPPMGYATLPPPPPPGGHPFEFYLYPRYPYAPAYPPYMMERARSVPPPVQRGKSKDRKKSSRSTKKDKKRYSGAGGRRYMNPSDVSTDSVGYTSEVGVGGDYPRMPRDFRRFENQFKHERAFSKSLAEESHRFPGDHPGNVYSLNESVTQRAAALDPDFNLY